MNFIKISVTVAASVASLCITVPVRAEQPQTITISSEAKPVLIAGKLQGCALNFEVGRHDPEYSQGRMIYMTGSLNLYMLERQMPFFGLKLGISPADSRQKFIAPTDAYLFDGKKTNRADFLQSMNGEMEGFRLFMFRAGHDSLIAAMERVAQTKTLMFAYAMRPGGRNAIVPVNLRMRQLNFDDPRKSEVGDQTITGWSDCIGEALKNARQAFKK